jgi:hypothetical protein
MTSPSSSREGIVTYANKTQVMNDTIANDKNKEGFSLVLHRDDSLEKDAHVNVDEYEDYDASSNGESYDTEQLVGKLEQALGFNTAIGANDNNKNYDNNNDNNNGNDNENDNENDNNDNDNDNNNDNKDNNNNDNNNNNNDNYNDKKNENSNDNDDNNNVSNYELASR